MLHVVILSVYVPECWAGEQHVAPAAPVPQNRLQLVVNEE
jgi:hypothetical protein